MKTAKINRQATLLCSLFAFLTLCACGPQLKPEQDELLVLQQKIQNMLNSSVADAAPLEMKFVQQKMALAQQARTDKKRKLEAAYIDEVKAEIKVAQLRNDLNRLNDELLNKRDKASAAEVYLLDLKEQLK